MKQFEKESATYGKNKDRLLKDGVGGQFVLIKSDAIQGVYPTAELAYKAGLEKFGNVPMFIKQIAKEDVLHSVPALFLGLLNARL